MKSLSQHIYENNFHKSEITEKLVINKNYVNFNNFDELIDNEIDFNEGEKIRDRNKIGQFLWISTLLDNSLNIAAHSIKDINIKKEIIKGILNVINFNDSYLFEYGALKPRNQRPNSKSLRAFVGKNFELINPEHTPSENNNSDTIDFERVLLYDNDEFWVYCDIGAKYTFVLIGSSEITKAIISKNK